MNATEFPDYPLPQRQAIADLWFTTMFDRFKRDVRTTNDSPFSGEADKLCAKIAASTGQFSSSGFCRTSAVFSRLFSKQRGQDLFRILGQQSSAGADLSRPRGRCGETLGGMA